MLWAINEATCLTDSSLLPPPPPPTLFKQKHRHPETERKGGGGRGGRSATVGLRFSEAREKSLLNGGFFIYKFEV